LSAPLIFSSLSFGLFICKRKTGRRCAALTLPCKREHLTSSNHRIAHFAFEVLAPRSVVSRVPDLWLISHCISISSHLFFINETTFAKNALGFVNVAPVLILFASPAPAFSARFVNYGPPSSHRVLYTHHDKADGELFTRLLTYQV
jgi:hypothetical protein